MTEKPEEPLQINLIDGFAIEVDEIMQSYLRAEFTREEAFELTKIHLTIWLGMVYR